MRGFEKISFEQFKKDIIDDEKIYETYELPVRKTKYSAGYDFIAMKDIIIKPDQIVKIPSGYKSYFLKDEVLLLFVRSSMGFKGNIRMCNQVGIIESDYYNNVSNEGHMWIALQNEGNKEYIIKKGESYAQGVFTKFLTCNDNPEGIRKGGLGSTNREGE